VITTFDVIHDAVDPAGILRAIRAALRPAGRYVCVDINCSERPTDNTGTNPDSSTGSASATA
jgi:2-polyprenyl-3-methyl-5-hydroxy-6-metoxy-1,4-benzoquinol methylase